MDRIWITIEELLDTEKSEIDLTEDGKLTLKARSLESPAQYGFVMDLFKGINKSASGWNIKGRNIMFTIVKNEDDQEEYWSRLTKEKIKNQKITVDWARWVDEDEVTEAPVQDDGDMQGFDGYNG